MNVAAPVGAVATPGVEAIGVVTPQTLAHLARPISPGPSPLAYFERVEHIAEATLALVSRPPREQTGVAAVSYDDLDGIGRSTLSLDGREVVQARGAATAPA